MRLTYKDQYGRWYSDGSKASLQIGYENWPSILWGEAVDKLATYEDAEEQGLLVRLPCKVGDTAYIIWDSDIYPENSSVVREDHITQVKFTTKGYAFKTWRGWYHKSDIGKTVFLTREEAESALKGAQNDG